MIVMTVEYVLKSGKTPEVLQALKEMSSSVKTGEPGCVGYQVLRSTDAEDRLLLIETYRDQEALDAHRLTPHFKSILEQRVLPLLEDRQRHHYTPEIA